MVTLEQVSRRVFSDPTWLIKSIIGAFLLVLPPWVFTLGYLYRVAEQGRRGQPLDLPDWDDWGSLFRDGLKMLVIVLAWIVIPIFLGWLIVQALQWVPILRVFGPLLYMPMVPGLVFGFPLAAAALYRFQRREDFRDAVHLAVLLRMIAAARGQIAIPTLAYIGFLFVLFPLFPYALFTGGLIIFYYFAMTFRQIEINAHGSASAPSEIRR